MAAKTKKSAKVKPASKTAVRQLPRPEYRSFKLSKRIRHPAGKLPASRRILATSLRHLLSHKRLFAGLWLMYLLLSLLLVQEFNIDTGLNDLRNSVEELFAENGGQIATGLTLFGVLLESTGTAQSETGGVYNFVILAVISLAVIWLLRQTMAGEKVSLKDSLYKGMYPLIPFLLVFLMVILQLLPLFIGGSLYGIVAANGLAVNFLEQFVWGLFVAMTALLSLYMLSSSLFALYIVTLPEMTPMKALRSARELVRYRRWTVMRKVIMLPIWLVLISAVIMLPLLLYATPAAAYAFFALSTLALIIAHAYMYSLYRELL